MPQVLPSTGIASAAKEKRYGCIAARIYSSHTHQLSIDTPSAQAGRVVHCIVQDVTRKPEEAAAAKWVCRHPSCAGKKWESKAALLAAHPDQRLLKERQETHLYLAVAEIEAIPAVAEHKDEKGRALRKGVEAMPARVMLLSDEE